LKENQITGQESTGAFMRTSGSLRSLKWPRSTRVVRFFKEFGTDSFSMKDSNTLPEHITDGSLIFQRIGTDSFFQRWEHTENKHITGGSLKIQITAQHWYKAQG